MNAERFRRLQDVLNRRQPDLTVVMERVHKPRNFSAILRSCDAVGVLEAHAVAADEGLALHEHVAAGTERWVSVREHGDVDDAFARLEKEGFEVVASEPAPEAEDFRALDYTRPTAFLVGTELYGLSEAARERANRVVEIPMEGMVRSLNVSVAAALLLYEAQRQRRDAGLYDAPRLPPDRYKKILFEWAYPRVAEQCRRTGRPYPSLGKNGALRRPG